MKSGEFDAGQQNHPKRMLMLESCECVGSYRPATFDIRRNC